jgi:hypothetical protein
MVKTSGKRKSYKVFGVIEYFTGRFWYQGQEGRLTAETSMAFLPRVLAQVTQPILLIQDGAKYHTSVAMQRFFALHTERLTVFQLPRYSPDYDPIEKLQQWPRRLKCARSENLFLKAIALPHVLGEWTAFPAAGERHSPGWAQRGASQAHDSQDRPVCGVAHRRAPVADVMTAPYGSWKSPITSDVIVAATIGLTDVLLDGEDVYWIETRPHEAGRYVVVHCDQTGVTHEVRPATFDARTRVHEYGAGAVMVADRIVVASHFADQRLYRQDGSGAPRPLTADGFRYADGIIDRIRRRWIGVCEDHTDPNREAINALVEVDIEGVRPERLLVAGSDFYSSPRLSPDGTRLAWLSWNHPNMP